MSKGFEELAKIGGEPSLCLVLAKIRFLKPHEEVVESHLYELVESMKTRGYRGPPVLVERTHLIIMDGHHRVSALRVLGAEYAPALLIDYNDNRVTLTSWRPGAIVSCEEVARRALSGELYPPKTTRHIVRIPLPTIIASLRDLTLGDPRGVRVEWVPL